MSFFKHPIDLSKFQVKELIKALENTSPINMKFGLKQLQSGKGVPIMLTKTQMNQLNKAVSNNKGLVLKFSGNQISKMKKDGGVIPILAALAPFAIAALTGAAGAAGTFGANKALQALDKAFKKKDGTSIYPPGYTGQSGNGKPGYNYKSIKGGANRVSNLSSKPAGRGMRPAGTGMRPAGTGMRPAGTGLFPAGVKIKKA